MCTEQVQPGVLDPLVERAEEQLASRLAYPFADLHGHLRRLFDTFGPRRMFWGTDLTRMDCTYYECIHMFTDHLPWLRGSDLEWVMGRGVCEWIGWDLGADAVQSPGRS